MIMISTVITSSPSHYDSNDNNDHKDDRTITTITTTAHYSGDGYHQYVVREYEDKFPPISPVFPFLNKLFFKT